MYYEHTGADDVPSHAVLVVTIELAEVTRPLIHMHSVSAGSVDMLFAGQFEHMLAFR